MALKAKFVKNYKTRKTVNGESVLQTRFIYNVSGTEEELKAYEEAQGEYYQTDDKTGKALYFSTSYAGDNIELTIGDNGVYTDTSEMDKLKSLIDQYGEATVRIMMTKGLI
jgi:hypothetical protein